MEKRFGVKVQIPANLIYWAEQKVDPTKVEIFQDQVEGLITGTWETYIGESTALANVRVQLYATDKYVVCELIADEVESVEAFQRQNNLDRNRFNNNVREGARMVLDLYAEKDWKTFILAYESSVDKSNRQI